MILLLVFALLSGLATVISPCILPVLPIVLSSSIGGGRWRPIGIIVGLVASFAVATLAVSVLVTAIGIPPDTLRLIAIVVIAAAGLSLLIPQLMVKLETVLSRAGQLGTRLQGQGTSRRGLAGGLILGLALGLVWAPCAGPILASVIALAATNKVSAGVAAVVVAYALGGGISMLAVAYGGPFVLRRVRRLSGYTGTVQRAFGVLMILTALAMFTNVDRSFEVWAVSALPASWSTPLIGLEQTTAVKQALSDLRTPSGQQNIADAAGASATKTLTKPTGATGHAGGDPAAMDAHYGLQNLGPASDFAGITHWFNTAHPLTLASLRGKVVLVDFWTYSCINCLRTLPHVTAWYQRYAKLGLVVVGVHTPEFPFEYVQSNVEQAVKQLHITYPVAMDNHYDTWNAFNNEYWPAEYLIDANGVIRHEQFGEGDYNETEQDIQQLLRDAGRHVNLPLASTPDLTPTYNTTPETYVGSDRMTGFASPQKVTPGHSQTFTTPSSLAGDSWALAGRWQINPSEATALHAGDSLDFVVTASKVFVVLSPQTADDKVRVLLDGKPVVTGKTAGVDVRNGVIQAHMDNLYNVVDLQGGVGTHHLRLIFETPGTQVYSFTFG